MDMRILPTSRPRASRALRSALAVPFLLVGALAAGLGTAATASAGTPCQSACASGFSTSVSTSSGNTKFSTTAATTASIYVYDSAHNYIGYAVDNAYSFSHQLNVVGLHPNNDYTYT